MTNNYLRFGRPGRAASLVFFDSNDRSSIEAAWNQIERYAPVPAYRNVAVYRGSDTKMVPGGNEWEVVGAALAPIDPRVPVIGYGPLPLDKVAEPSAA